MSTRILLVDDHAIVRSGLRWLLEKQGGITVVGEAGDGHDAVRLAAKLAPQIVIMDIGMPGLNGIEATRRIHTQHPALRVIALSMHSDPRFVTEILRAGASGYVLKEAAFEDLLHAIRAVLQGHTYLSPPLQGMIVEEHVRRPQQTEPSSVTLLTSREREVLQLLAEGHSSKEISARLGCSVKTVEVHRSRIMQKLHLHSVAALTKYAIRAGLTSLER